MRKLNPEHFLYKRSAYGGTRLIRFSVLMYLSWSGYHHLLKEIHRYIIGSEIFYQMWALSTMDHYVLSGQRLCLLISPYTDVNTFKNDGRSH